MQKEPEVIFANLKSSNEPFIVQSMCINCEKNGTTTMLLTNIPFFREIVVVSFCCDECGYRNSEIQFGGQLADQGVKLKLKVQKEKDLNRQLIKSEHASIMIPEIDFEIPSNKKGEITTIEGLLNRCIEDISKEQAVRKVIDQHLYTKIQEFLVKLNQLKTPQGLPFTIIIDDPSGLSFIKNPFAPKIDPQMHVQLYNRTIEQIQDMGYSAENTKEIVRHQEEEITGQLTSHKIDMTKPITDADMKKEAFVFQVPCHACGLMGETKMCETNIPYFKDLMIMCFTCDHCGAHSTETKTSGNTEEYGIKITLKHPDLLDLKRDLFKSDTCAVEIPELELELDYGTLGGVYTTVEGLLEKIHNHLDENNPFADSDKEFGQRMTRLLQELNQCRFGERQFTLIMVDPVSHSFLQNPNHPDPETKVIVEKFERTAQQNEFLGLTDMKVEDYN